MNDDVRHLLERLTDTEPRSNAMEILERAEDQARRFRRRRTQHKIATTVFVAALIVGIAVVAARSHGDRHPAQVTITPTSVTPISVPVNRYSVDAIVLQSPSHGPQFCISVYDSLPPQCDGTPVAPWNWTKFTGQTSINGTTWGRYHLVGSYDGATFTLTEPATPPHAQPPKKLPSFKTPCPTPPGGWVVLDRSHFSLDAYNRFAAAARSQPDAAGLWLDTSTPVDGSLNLFPEQVITVAFTKNLAAHRAQLRTIWGGPLCVVQHDHSIAELNTVIRSLTGAAGRHLGLQVRGGSIDEVDNTVELEVMIATSATQHALDHQYGPGLVHLIPILTPLP
jgi:hypothetical protein